LNSSVCSTPRLNDHFGENSAGLPEQSTANAGAPRNVLVVYGQAKLGVLVVGVKTVYEV
jgi:hypothetical protein